MHILDVRGQKCPLPIIATKKALKEVDKGEYFEVITDRQNSMNNLARFLTDNRIKYSVKESENVWTFTIIKEEK